MKPMNPIFNEENLPVDFEGEHLNMLIAPSSMGTHKVWVCIDGRSVLRARGLSVVTTQDDRMGFSREQEQDTQSTERTITDRMVGMFMLWAFAALGAIDLITQGAIWQ